MTTVEDTWEVRTANGWMTPLAPIARPIVAWNSASRRQGGEALDKRLRARLVEITHA